jgi:HD-like signal output (HDOD) protein/ActR/RegA family two-component response regulator
MNRSRKNILYVASPRSADTALSESVNGLNPNWAVSVARSAAETLALFDQNRYDAIIANEQLDDMDGFRLLDTIQQRHPDAHRLIVADLSNPRVAVKSAGAVHQCLPKPIDLELLRSALERVFLRNIWLSNRSVRELLGQMSAVPSPPELYMTIIRALRDPSTDLEEISTQAEQDPGMSAKLLQLANSAALGLGQKVVRVHDAIGYLGLEMTRALVLLAHTFAYCNRRTDFDGRIARLWKHSLRTGVLARRLARLENCSSDEVDESFLAGVLHDIGELLLLVNMPEKYKQVLAQAGEKHSPLWLVELEHFGATHAELGAELMAIWNLPHGVVEALALHHHPSKLFSSTFGPLAAVHVADVFEQEFSQSAEEGSSIDQSFLNDLGVGDRIETWRACAAESSQEEL